MSVLQNAAMSKLTNHLLANVSFISIPNNPRNKKEAVRPTNYLFVSTRIIEKKDEAGVVHQFIKGSSCRRGEPKAPSKRDLHRMEK